MSYMTQKNPDYRSYFVSLTSYVAGMHNGSKWDCLVFGRQDPPILWLIAAADRGWRDPFISCFYLVSFLYCLRTSGTLDYDATLSLSISFLSDIYVGAYVLIFRFFKFFISLCVVIRVIGNWKLTIVFGIQNYYYLLINLSINLSC